MAQQVERKRNTIISATNIITDDGVPLGVQFQYWDGTSERLYFPGAPVADEDDCISQSMMLEAACHGLKAKVVDAAAISRETGRTPTPDTKKEAAQAMVARIKRGEWLIRAGAGEGKAAVGGLLLRALIRTMPHKTPEELAKWLDGKTAEQQAKLRADDRIAPVILAIKAEDAAEKAQRAPQNSMAEDLLGELAEAEPEAEPEDEPEAEPEDEEYIELLPPMEPLDAVVEPPKPEVKPKGKRTTKASA